MHRRELLQLVGSAASLAAFGGLTPERLLALGTETHARAAGAALQSLSAANARTVATIADLVIPATDTPGALDVGAVEFIDLLLTAWYPAAEREALIAAIAAAEAAPVTGQGAPLSELSGAPLLAAATALDAAGPREAGSAREGWQAVKRLTAFAYFTSKPVMQDVLQYKVWPGRWGACEEVTSVGTH